MGGMKDILFVLLVLGASQARAAVQTFDLKKSIQYALEKSPQFNSLKRQLNISIMERKNARAGWFPKLDLEAVHGMEETDPKVEGTTTPWRSELSLTLTENLYDNGVTNTTYKVATLNERVADYQFKDQQNRLSLNLALAYLEYSLNVKLLEIQEKQFKLISKQYDLTTREYRNGMRTKKDYLRFKTQVSRAEIDLIESKSEVEKSKQELLSLLALELPAKDTVEFIPLTLDGIKDDLNENPIALEDHLTYKSAQLRKKANSLNTDLARRKQYPELFLSAGATYGSSDYIDTGRSFSDNETTSWNALITIRYNFLDWGTRSRDSQIASQRAIIENNEIDTSVLTLRSTLNQLKIDKNLTQKNFKLAGELFSLEKENITLIEREYRNGNVSYLDLITGLNDLADAERKFYSASSDILSTRFNLLYHQGILYEELLK